MQLDLKSVLYTPGARIEFSEEYDFSDFEFGAQRPVAEPVKASGAVRNMAGVILLEGEISTTLHCVCDRCQIPFEKEFKVIPKAVLSEEPDEEDDMAYPIINGEIDVDEIITSAFVLDMDSLFLCRPDCKGLCPKCGADLNSGSCGCGKEADPRWAALEGLFD